MPPFRPPCSCGHQPPAERPCKPSCGCGDHDRPPRPSCGGFLVPKILGVGKYWQRCLKCDLDVRGLSKRAQPPLTLCRVSACGQDPWWEERPCRERNALELCVTIPLTVEVRDACGCVYSGSAEIEIPVRIRLSCPSHECWRHKIVLTPCVRLAGRACEACGTRFEDVPLEVACDAYVVSYCAVGAPCEPPCPNDLPLYPQPRY